MEHRIPPLLVLLTLAFVAHGTGSARAQSSCRLFPAESFPAGIEPVDLAVADFDGDGDLDAVVADTQSKNVILLANDGDGRFPVATTIALGLALNVELRCIAAGDLDGDLDPDVVVGGSQSSAQFLLIVLNQGGTLGLTGTVAGFPGYSGVALADLDGDGDLDAAGTTALWRNDGTGAFSLGVDLATVGGQSADELGTGDVDGDGDVDVSTIRSGASTPLQTFLNQGAWTFAHPPDVLFDCCGKALAVGDVDGDGRADRCFSTLNNGITVVRTGSTQTYPSPGTGRPHALQLGDADGDGDLDLVAAHAIDSNRGTLRVWTNQSGLFTVGTDVCAGDDFGVSMAVADLDGDGLRDLLSAERLQSTLSPRLATAAGTFPGIDGIATANVMYELALADCDGDGLLDVLASASPTSVWKNAGGAGFVPVGFAMQGSGPLLAVDVNGDARPDLVRADDSVNAIQIAFNNGTAPTAPVFGQDSLFAAHDLAAGDVDADGDMDFVVGATNAASITLLRNADGQGTLQATAIAVPGAGLKSVELVDLDGDADLDVAVTSFSAATLSWLANDGTGTFGAPQSIPAFAGGNPRALVVVDLDRDGDPDLVTGTAPPGRLDVLLNVGAGVFLLAGSHVLEHAVVRLQAAQLGGEGLATVIVTEASQDFGPLRPGRIALWTARADGTLAHAGFHMNGRGALGIGIGDLDGDARPDLCFPGATVTRMQNFGAACGTGSTSCPGDGSIGACPCGNGGAVGHGCASSLFAGGALLAGEGVASVTHDTLVLRASDLSGTTCLFFQGTALDAPIFADDGLQCIGGAIRRIGNVTAAGGLASYPGPGNVAVSVRGQVPPFGGQHHYQAFYRNGAAFCTPGTSNRTNGLTLVWGP